MTMEPMFHCESCDEPVYDYSDITIHKTRNAGDHEIVEV